MPMHCTQPMRFIYRFSLFACAGACVSSCLTVVTVVCLCDSCVGLFLYVFECACTIAWSITIRATHPNISRTSRNWSPTGQCIRSSMEFALETRQAHYHDMCDNMDVVSMLCGTDMAECCLACMFYCGRGYGYGFV